jgi:hypothetical protein
MVSETSGALPVQVRKPWVELPEAILLLGIASLVAGAWMIYRPAAFILFGLICIAASLNIYGYFRRNREKK